MEKHESIYVDLDKTLAKYTEYKSHLVIGDPIPLMLYRVKNWLASGQNVKIFTARVSPGSLAEHKVTVDQVCAPIIDWCVKYLGQELEITCVKDWDCKEIWDDKAIQIVPNEGNRVDGKD